jgi:hypothetical protein
MGEKVFSLPSLLILSRLKIEISDHDRFISLYEIIAIIAGEILGYRDKITGNYSSRSSIISAFSG